MRRDDVHLPAPSYFPMVASLGLPIIAYGMIYRTYAVVVIGALFMLGAIYAWGLEPSTAPHDEHRTTTTTTTTMSRRRSSRPRHRSN